MSETTTSPGTVPQLPEDSEGIRNIQEQHQRPSRITKITKTPVDKLRQELDETAIETNYFDKIKRWGEDRQKNLKRQIRSLVYNQRDYDESKKDEAIKLLEKHRKHGESGRISPLMTKDILQQTPIDSSNYEIEGKSYTEYAEGWIQLHDKKGEWELQKVKTNFKVAFSKAKTEHGMRLAHKTLNGRRIPFIPLHGEDLDEDLEKSGGFGDNIIGSVEKTTRLRRTMKNEERLKKEEEQKQSQEIIVDTEGHEVSEQ